MGPQMQGKAAEHAITQLQGWGVHQGAEPHRHQYDTIQAPCGACFDANDTTCDGRMHSALQLPSTPLVTLLKLL